MSANRQSDRMNRRSILRAAAAGATGALAAQVLHGSAAAAAEQGSQPKEGHPGGRLKQSISQWCYERRLPIERLIREAKRIGFAAIELVGRQHWDAIRQGGLKIACVGGHASIPNGLNRRENHERIEAELRKNIDLAVEYEIPNLVCMAGNRRGLPDDQGIANTVEGFKRVAKYAEEKNVTLCLELLNSKVDHKDYQCDHTEWGVEVCRRVGSPRVRLLYDIYHMQIMEGDLIRTIGKHYEYIGHFHTGGNPGRNEIDQTQEIYYPAVLKAIADKGYSGYIGHEFIPKGDPVAALESAFRISSV
jgi:hydroxypyruvate isomerase